MKKLILVNNMKNTTFFKSALLAGGLMFVQTFSFAQQVVPAITIKDLQKMLNKETDSTLIVNFFATWCKPCVHELPLLAQMMVDSSNTKYKFVFVSCDNPDNREKKVTKFAKKKKIAGSTYLLLDSSNNYWMQAIDRRWQGSIPATLVYNQKLKKKAFFEGEMLLEDLQGLLKKVK
jgi:thiol-disulfide isomerase/thioredoxin